ncbi:MAG: hypothetical protein E6G22_03010 [Actinobacteria bacterium]|nr:MAG: hypothetical protein E6G22_03010 [Actinomycetota bacterium]
MKRIIVFVVATAMLALAATGPAGAAPARTKTPTLAQFNALSKKVTTLQKQVKLLSTDVNILAAYDVCLTAATADALQGTWIFVNKGSSVFPTTSTGGSAISDLQACSAFKIARQLPSTDTPPSTAVFSALTGLFG